MSHHFIGKRLALVALCLGLLIALGRVPTAFAAACTTVCYVDAATGSDANDGDTAATAKKTIQAAVNQVTAGGQVYVLDGLYPETVTVNKAVTITGNGPANTTVDPASGNGFGITASNVTIEDLKITDAAQGARLSGTISGITFDNVHFVNNTSRGIEMQTPTTDLITNVQVLNSLFDNNSLGMNMSTSTRVDGILIENTTFQNHANSGFQQNNGNNVGWVKNLTVRDSTFNNNGTTSGSAGVYAEEFSNVLIEDSTFTGNRYGVNLFDYYNLAASTTTNVVIRNNTFTDHKASTIALRSITSDPSAQLFLIDNNTINQNVGVLAGATQAHIAVSLSSANPNGAVDVIDNDLTFSGTFLLANSATYGIYLAGRAEDVEIEGNTIDGGGVGTNGAAIPSSGIRIVTSVFQTNANINITRNLINNFVNGVSIHDGNNAMGGIQANSVVKINRNDLSGNTAYGIQSGPATATNGKCNWWGDASGPGPVGPGSGSNVSTDVTYAVWLFNNNLNGGNVTNIDTGEVFCSIQEAIDDSDTLNGHTIVASAGVYQENVTVHKSVTLNGANAGVSPNDPITPLNPNGARGPESELAVTGNGVAFKIHAPDVTIDGFKFTDSAVDQTHIQMPLIATGWNYGGEGPGFKVVNNLFSETSRVLFYSNGPNQITDGTIDNNRVQDPGRADTNCGTAPATAPSSCGYQLFNLWRIDGLSFQGNVTAANPGSGDRIRTLNVFNSTEVIVADNTIRNTCIYNCFNIAAGTSGNVEVTGNDVVTDVGSVVQIHSSWTTAGATINVHHNTFTTGADFPIVVDAVNADLDNVHINRNVLIGDFHARNGTPPSLPGTETLDITCNWWGGVGGPNKPNGLFGPLDYTPWLYTNDLDGPCYIGGTIEIEKVAEGGGNTVFEFDLSWTTPITLTNGGSYITSPPLPEGTYSVGEVNLPIGWSQQSATCDNSATTPVETVNPSTITVADGDAWVCTFTNVYDPTGSITITKETDPDGGAGFTFTLEPNTYPFLSKWGSYGSGNGQFKYPFGMAVDGSGNVFVTDQYNHRIQKFDSSGTWLAAWGSYGTGDGQFNYPIDVAIDTSGNVYIADNNNNRIQKFDNNGLYLGQWGSSGTGDGQFAYPYGVAVDGAGNVYVADTENHRIQKFDNNGLYLGQWGSYGSSNGLFNNPYGVEVDGSGNVYVSDTYNHRIQKFDSAGTWLATWGGYGSGNGLFSYPSGLAMDVLGNVYVTDANSLVQKFDANGAFLTQWGGYGSANSQFAYPYNVAVDESGYIYVSDTYNHRIQKFGLPSVVLDDDESHTFAKLPVATYTVSETDLPPNWSLDSATCDNAVTTEIEAIDPASIPVAIGDAWECLFTNVYIPPPTNVCNVQDSSALWTDIIGKGMGNPKKHKAQVKLTIPNYAAVDSLYGQMVAKNTGIANYVRFIMPGKNNWVQVNAITSPAAQQAGNFWYGDYIPAAKLPTKSVTGRWYLQSSGTKNHIPRALVLYPTYADPVNTWVNIWNTYDAAEAEVYWDTALGWTPTQVITESIAPPNGPTTFNVELALVDNDKDARPVWVTVEAGGVTQTQKPNNPSDGEQLNLMTFTLAGVPPGTDTITITVYSPSAALDGVIGDSAALVGMRANYMCAPLVN